MTHDERAREAALKCLKFLGGYDDTKPMHVAALNGFVFAITDALRAVEQETLERAARIVCKYNCDHDHGKAATTACEEVEVLLIRAAKEK